MNGCLDVVINSINTKETAEYPPHDFEPVNTSHNNTEVEIQAAGKPKPNKKYPAMNPT